MGTWLVNFADRIEWTRIQSGFLLYRIAYCSNTIYCIVMCNIWIERADNNLSFDTKNMTIFTKYLVVTFSPYIYI